ncbi:hypothetical protein [Dyadobacter flavalbus]|nr:hypothetical protein [Dyadobacter flavalbus]
MKINFTSMKYSGNYFAVLLTAIVLNGCDTKTNQKTEAASDSVVVTQPPADAELNSDQSTLLEAILGSSDEEAGTVRGIAFGDPVSKVKSTEKFELFEETADHLGYTSETAKLETIDVQYFFSSDKKINRITVDVYLNSPAATKELWNAGKSHFNEAYGAPKEESKKITWNKNSVRVNMEDVSEGKDYGLKFQFVPTDKNVLAVK